MNYCSKSRSFSVAGPSLWNRLPPSARAFSLSSGLSTFLSLLNTCFFSWSKPSQKHLWVSVEYVPTFCFVNKICLRSKFYSFTQQQHPPPHRCGCRYAFGLPVETQGIGDV